MLNDVEHVEAVALIRRFIEAPGLPEPDLIAAGENWLRENHPPPEAYTAAARSLTGGVAEDLRDEADGMGG